jgi:hypothetical protein
MTPIARELGTKGVSWSNIIIGEQAHRILRRVPNVINRCYNEYGAVLLLNTGVGSLTIRDHLFDVVRMYFTEHV